MNNRAINIFRRFLTRDDTRFAESFDETFLEVMRVTKAENMKAYLKVSRKGSTVPLTRRQRMSIWGLWENAQNHADYEDWLDEA